MEEKFFEFYVLGEAAAFNSGNSYNDFLINDGKNYPNRKLKLTNNTFLFDGYSTWFSGDLGYLPENFTISILLAPMSFESGRSGLITRFNAKEKSGFHISAENFGSVIFGFGDGNQLFECSSINNHLSKQKWNILTIVFNSKAGWCDICINGMISNRKQFPRHTTIKYIENQCFIGKYIDCNENLEISKTGVFNGYIRNAKLVYRALKFEEVLEEHTACLCKIALEPQNLIIKHLNRDDYTDDVQRPKYHLIAPGKWMNEPHGPLYFKGYYHIFYQANPHAPLWDNIQWGHMISSDMVNWSDLPLALETEKNDLDPDGCWSGSSCIDKNGLPVLFYTAGNNKKFPNQGIAMARPDMSENAQLIKWNKNEKLIVEQTIDDGWLGEFRDPFVWLQENTYYMLVGTGDANNGGGNAIIYSSDDLMNWTSHGFLMEYDYELNEEVGHIWELPVLLPLKNEDGRIVNYILLICACQVENSIVDTFYWIGDWDPAHKKFIKHHDKARLLDLGNGVFTGPSGFVTPDGRTVIFTIAQGKRKFDDEFNSGWAHNGGLPVELYSKNNQVCIKPIREIYSLKNKLLIDKKNISVRELNMLLENIKSNMFYVKLSSDSNYIGIETTYGDESLEVFYDKIQYLYGAKKGNKSSLVSRLRGEIDKVYINDNEMEMEYFLDHSMIEVYLNNLKSITLRNYSNSKYRKLKIMADDDIVIKNFELWELKNI